MKEKAKKAPKEPRQITGQVMYMGPRVPHLGLGYAAIFRDGIFPHLYLAIAHCPALGGLFVPIADVGAVRRELAFDYSHNMRGETGKHVTFYREVQKWIASLSREQKTHPAPGVTLKENHA